jgi:hypothetical protein
VNNQARTSTLYNFKWTRSIAATRGEAHRSHIVPIHDDHGREKRTSRKIGAARAGHSVSPSPLFSPPFFVVSCWSGSLAHTSLFRLRLPVSFSPSRRHRRERELNWMESQLEAVGTQVNGTKRVCNQGRARRGPVRLGEREGGEAEVVAMLGNSSIPGDLRPPLD